MRTLAFSAAALCALLAGPVKAAAVFGVALAARGENVDLHGFANGVFRHKVRTIFTLLSVFTAFLLFGLLDAVRSGFAITGQSGANRLLTASRISFGLPLRNSVRCTSLMSVFGWLGGFKGSSVNGGAFPPAPKPEA